MDEPLEEAYFNWLCAKVTSINDPNYIGLLRLLFETEFIWFVRNDKNRAAEGCELREEFLRVADMPRDEDWFAVPCSVFEVLVAFAYKAAFQIEISVRDWFWMFLRNLGLDEYRRVHRSDIPVIQDIVATFMFRTYESNGYGGLFPLREPSRDQREVEIWYQFCEYVDEQGLI